MIRKHRIALLAAGTFNFALFFPVLFMGRVISPNDVFFNYEPWASVRHVSVQNQLMNDPPTSFLTHVVLLRTLTSFHWDPFVASGVPGTAWGLSSPFIVLTAFLFPLSWFYTVLVFLKVNVAFFFAYLWLRQERLGKRGAAIGAIVIAGSGIYAVRLLWHSTNATPLYPALLWLVRRAFDDKRTSFTLTAIVSLVYALAAFPATMAYGAYLALAYAVFLAIRNRRVPWRRVGLSVAAVVVAIVIASPSLITYARFVLRTGYLEGRHDVSLHVFFPLEHFRSFIDPDRLGNNIEKNWRGDSALGILNNYYEATVYLGLLPLLLAPIALANRRARDRWFWAAAGAIIVLAMFGIEPVAALIGRIPGFRYSALPRISVLLPVCAGNLAAAATSLLTRRRFRFAIAAAIALATAFDLGAFAGRFHPYLRPADTVIPETPMISFLHNQPKPFRIAPFFIYLWPNSAEMLALEDVRSHFLSEASYRRMMQRIDPTAWSGTSTVIQFNSLKFDFHDPLVAMLGIRYFIENRDIDIVKWTVFKDTKPAVEQKGALVLHPGEVFARTIAIDRQPFNAIEVPITVEATTRLRPTPTVTAELWKANAVVFRRAFTASDIQVMNKIYVPVRPYATTGDRVTLRLVSSGVRARVLGSVPESGETPLYYGRVEGPLIFDRELPDGRLFLDVTALPRFYPVRDVVSMTDDAFFARRDIDLGREAVITGGGVVPTSPGGADARVVLTKYTPSDERVLTSAPRPFFLASSEKLTPDMEVRIDGDVVKPFLINSLFTGVEIPAGRHEVAFLRRIGRGWWWPSGIASLILLAAAFAEAWRSLQRRRQPATAFG